MGASPINQTLDALASLARAALPLNVTVYAPDQALDPVAIFPVVMVYPWRLHLERTTTGMWGTLEAHHPHAHGPDLWRYALLELPESPLSDQDVARRSLQTHVDQLRAALIASPTLPDDLGVAQVLDAADHLQADYAPAGAVISWHQRPYMGAYVTIAVQPLWQRAGEDRSWA